MEKYILCPYDIRTDFRYISNTLKKGPKALLAKGTRLYVIYPWTQEVDSFAFIVKSCSADAAYLLRFDSQDEAIQYGWDV